MEYIDTVSKILTENAGKSKEELKELVSAALPSLDANMIDTLIGSVVSEKIVDAVLEKSSDISEKMVDVVLEKTDDVSEKIADAVLSVAPVVATVVDKKNFVSLLKSVLKKLLMSCIQSTAVQVAHPPTPPLVSTVKVIPPADELPPLEPSPEKV